MNWLKRYLPIALQIATLIFGGLATNEYAKASDPRAKPGIEVMGVPVSSGASGLAALASLVWSSFLAMRRSGGAGTQQTSSERSAIGLLASQYAQEADPVASKLVSDLACHRVALDRERWGPTEVEDES